MIQWTFSLSNDVLSLIDPDGAVVASAPLLTQQLRELFSHVQNGDQISMVVM